MTDLVLLNVRLRLTQVSPLVVVVTHIGQAVTIG